MKNCDLPANPLPMVPCVDGTIIDAFEYNSGNAGLTKREIFAMSAMQGIMACGEVTTPSYVAVDSVTYADALLDELNKDK